MRGLEEPSSAFADYLGINGRPIVVFLALVIGTVAVVTVIYGAVFGFDTWSNNMQQAGSLMLSNFDGPVAGPGGTAQTPGAAPAAATMGGSQFNCPHCGGMALPRWSTQGQPLCPNCGGAVALGGAPVNKAKLAAAPG